MKKYSKYRMLFAVGSALSLVLAGCSSGVPVEPTTSGTPTSGQSTTVTPPEDVYYSVYFYDGETLLDTKTVRENTTVEKPADLFKRHYDFTGWFTDTAFTSEYDFSSLVTQDTYLYAGFNPVQEFADFDNNFIPCYSPFETNDVLYSSDVDPVIHLDCEALSMSPDIVASELLLMGAFEDMTISGIEQTDTVLTVSLSGSPKAGAGYIAFDKGVTNQEEYFVTTIDVIRREAWIDYSSVTLDWGDKSISFNVIFSGDKLNNPDELTPEDYLAKVQSKEYDYFHNDHTDKFTLSALAVNDAFDTMKFKIKSTADLSGDLLAPLKEMLLSFDATAFESGLAYQIHPDFSVAGSSTELFVCQSGLTKYEGKFFTRLANARVTNDFKDSIDDMLVDPINKNLLLKIKDKDVVITSLKVEGESQIHGTFTIDTDDLDDPGNIIIDFSDIVVSNEKTVKVAKALFTDDVIAVPSESTTYEVSVDAADAGTVSQTAASNYDAIKQTVQGHAFEEFEGVTIGDVVNVSKQVIMIAVNLYMGKSDLATNRIGVLLNIDALKSPTTLIMEQLVDIMNELKTIESKIDNIDQKIDELIEELREVHQEALLDSYLDANEIFRSFITNYEVPLMNIISNYQNSYFSYFYEFAMSTIGKNETTDITLDLHYDTDGKLAYPDEDHDDYTVDGKIIDKNATKSIPVYELSSALSGIRANEGHSYEDIEGDIAADFKNRSNYDNETLADIMKTIRFNAMSSHFYNEDRINEFVNAITNFSNALIGADMPSSLSTTPLDSYRIMLETVYSFGFEVEPDMNVAVIKLSSIYHSARSILEFVNYISAGKPVTDQFKELDEKVQDELKSDRFYKPNIDNHIYCYPAGCYVDAQVNSYAMYFAARGAIRITTEKVDFADVDNKFIINATNNWEGQEVSSFQSITQDACFEMAAKTMVYNKLKLTNYTLPEYLCKIGIIPQDKLEQCHGIILGINGVVSGDDCEDVNFGSGLTCFAGGSGPQSFSDLDGDYNHNYAVKGNQYTFADRSTHEGVIGISIRPYASTTSVWAGELYGYAHAYTDTYDIQNRGDWGWIWNVWSYYVNFVPVDVSQ